MSRDIQKDITEVLSLCSQGISVLGYNDFKVALSRIISSHYVLDQQNEIFIDFILDSVIKEWKDWKETDWTKEDFLKPNQRGEIILARNIAVVLIKTHTKLTYQEIADFFGIKYKQNIRKLIQDHEEMEESRHRLDVDLLERYDKLNIIIRSYIDTAKTRTNVG